MRRRTDRYAMDVTVELFAGGESRRVGVADVSRSGMFLCVSPPLPVGEPIHVAMFFEGRQLATLATVVHARTDDAARALGHRPGIGIAFDPPTCHSDTLFLRAVERMLARRVILRGDLAALGLPAILVMLEQERKSGRLELTGDHTAWIDLSGGAIVGAGSAAGATDMRTIMFELLEWRRGEFRLIATPPARASVAMPVTYFLMEHARLADERRARRATA
jgi:hypothetical protein